MSTLAEPAVQAPAHPARYFEREEDGRLRCTLCPRECRLGDGQAGFCFVRQNVGGEMALLAYGKSTGFAVDPIEKKPLFHFLPGTEVLSFGTVGCNMGCRFCQNWNTSKARSSERYMETRTPEQVVDLAVSAGCPSIAFTYNDPIIWAEWAIDVAREARRRGIRTVFVTSGFVKEKAREEIFSWMDATNVDLKAFTEEFYAKVTLSHLAPVLETLEWLARDGRVWTEVTNLLIPGLNDDPAETRRLSEWIGARMGPDVPLHFSAFHPAWKMMDRPRTPPETLTRARRIAREVGLRHVYTGNVHDSDGQTTFCPRCGKAVLVRDWNTVRRNRLGPGGKCRDCGERIAGRFEA
ncbi:MAG: Radical Pyruvate-formate lyase-activating enzyme like protein [Anaeromyxobacteraceae bacterium]|nr:Radical Pyruvate-formate lyase-activating enzyme like protein [Anaeromyxobacteraceae bacterium]